MIEIGQRIPMRYGVHNYLALEYLKFCFQARPSKDIYQKRILGREKL